MIEISAASATWGAIAAEAPLWFWLTAFGALGAILGSFVNAAVYRLPRGISMITRSHSFCPHCRKDLRWFHNIPLLSWLVLRGRCAYCHEAIPVRYFLIELFTALLFVAAAAQFFGLNMEVLRSADGQETTVRFLEPGALFFVRLFLILDLMCIAFCDLETWTIPYDTTWPWILAGLILAPIFPELHPAAVEWTANARWNAFIDAAQGLVFGAGLLWLVGFVCLVLIGKEGMGSGDMHLTGMIGAFLGWKAVVAVLFIGVFVGSFTGLAKLAWDKRQRKKNPNQTPWQPVFELPEGEPPQPPPAWSDAVLGAPVLLLEAYLLYIFTTRCGEPGFANLVSPYSAVIGGVIGVCLFLSWPVRRGQAVPQGEIRVREDGKKEEVLHGNYVPFGPSLALAGLVTAFYEPLLRAIADYWFFRNTTRFAYNLIGWPFDGFPPP